MNKIRGSHLYVAVANLQIVKTTEEKLETIANVIQPGFTYKELIELIREDGEIPEEYVNRLIEAGIQFPDFSSLNDKQSS